MGIKWDAVNDDQKAIILQRERLELETKVFQRHGYIELVHLIPTAALKVMLEPDYPVLNREGK